MTINGAINGAIDWAFNWAFNWPLKAVTAIRALLAAFRTALGTSFRTTIMPLGALLVAGVLAAFLARLWPLLGSSVLPRLRSLIRPVEAILPTVPLTILALVTVAETVLPLLVLLIVMHALRAIVPHRVVTRVVVSRLFVGALLFSGKPRDHRLLGLADIVA